MPPEIKLYNTLTRQTEVFEPINPGKVKLYVCGPTVYDEAHLGHARCYITWDVLYRFLTFMGYDVDYVRNITDVDDKILARARENSEPPEALTRRNIDRFHEVMAQLNTLSPTREPKATGHIDDMIRLIGNLLDKGIAYKGERTGTIYFDVSKDQDYGELTNQNLDDLQSGARVEVDAEKRSPLDFALWKPADASEALVWPAPWGAGRPGWHIECSAMSNCLLGDQLDIHAGGMDLIFPHHQNEIAQSEAFTGVKPFVRYWMHNGFVNVSGEKMSKSLGNFATVAKLLEVYDANTLRHFILTNKYRMPMDFNDEALAGSKNWAEKVAQNIGDLYEEFNINPDAPIHQPKALSVYLVHGIKEPQSQGEQTILSFIDAMRDDLNTPQALAFLNDLLSQANPKPGISQEERRHAFEAFLYLADNLGFQFKPVSVYEKIQDQAPYLVQLIHDTPAIEGCDVSEPTSGMPVSSLMDIILTIRTHARAQKNWTVSDMIRDRLGEIGIQIKDRKDGPPSVSYEPAKSVTAS